MKFERQKHYKSIEELAIDMELGDRRVTTFARCRINFFVIIVKYGPYCAKAETKWRNAKIIKNINLR